MGGIDSLSFRGDAEHRARNLEIPGSPVTRRPGMTNSRIQFLVAAEDAVLVEGNPPLAFEIGLDLRPRRDAITQREEAGDFLLERIHALGERIAQALDDLEQREVDIGDAPPGDIEAAIVLHQSLEIAEIFRHALLPEFIRALLRRRLLVLVVKRGSERMVGVVDLARDR